jgi:hypothetical protein
MWGKPAVPSKGDFDRPRATGERTCRPPCPVPGAVHRVSQTEPADDPQDQVARHGRSQHGPTLYPARAVPADPYGYPAPGYAQPEYPRPEHPQPEHPQPGRPQQPQQQGRPHQASQQQGYPRAEYPRQGYPRQAPPQQAYQQPGYVQPGYQQPGYVQPGYTQQGYARPGYAQPGYARPGYAQPPGVARRRGGPSSPPTIALVLSRRARRDAARTAQDSARPDPRLELIERVLAGAQLTGCVIAGLLSVIGWMWLAGRGSAPQGALTGDSSSAAAVTGTGLLQPVASMSASSLILLLLPVCVLLAPVVNPFYAAPAERRRLHTATSVAFAALAITTVAVIAAAAN